MTVFDKVDHSVKDKEEVEDVEDAEGTEEVEEGNDESEEDFSGGGRERRNRSTFPKWRASAAQISDPVQGCWREATSSVVTMPSRVASNELVILLATTSPLKRTSETTEEAMQKEEQEGTLRIASILSASYPFAEVSRCRAPRIRSLSSALIWNSLSSGREFKQLGEAKDGGQARYTLPGRRTKSGFEMRGPKN
jgi:hypothetical protein